MAVSRHAQGSTSRTTLTTGAEGGAGLPEQDGPEQGKGWSDGNSAGLSPACPVVPANKGSKKRVSSWLLE